MTVKELKEKLNDFDDDLTVVVFDQVNDFLEIIVKKDITISKKNVKAVENKKEWVLVTNITGSKEVVYIY